MAVPSRVSLLILYTNAESCAYSRDSSQCSQRCPYIFKTIHHRVSHDFIGSHDCVPMAFTAKSPLCPNIITAVLHLYKRRKFNVHGTVSYVGFQHIPGYDVLLLYTMDRFLPPLPTYACQRVRNLLYGTISYVVFQNIVTTTVLFL